MKRKARWSLNICVLLCLVILLSAVSFFFLDSAVDPPSAIPTSQPVVLQPPPKPEKENLDIHFIHIPKCGGTTMTTVLREMQCHLDPIRNSDCCTNPGFCDWHAHRRCSSIKGCINHFPNRATIFKPVPSVAIFREPIARLISAWFYRGHSPNLDFFDVRPEFKEIHKGLRPKVLFNEYLEMHEYQNIQTRMLGADSFPYRNVTVTDTIFLKAVDALEHLFFIGIQEEFEVSALALIQTMNITDLKPTINKEREQISAKLAQDKKDLRSNTILMNRARQVNAYDIKLYEIAVQRFCANLKANYPELSRRVALAGKVNCK